MEYTTDKEWFNTQKNPTFLLLSKKLSADRKILITIRYICITFSKQTILFVHYEWSCEIWLSMEHGSPPSFLFSSSSTTLTIEMVFSNLNFVFIKPDVILKWLFQLNGCQIFLSYFYLKVFFDFIEAQYLCHPFHQSFIKFY